jgi:hypothetical protein
MNGFEAKWRGHCQYAASISPPIAHVPKGHIAIWAKKSASRLNLKPDVCNIVAVGNRPTPRGSKSLSHRGKPQCKLKEMEMATSGKSTCPQKASDGSEAPEAGFGSLLKPSEAKCFC